MNKIEIRSRAYHPYGDEKKPLESIDEIYINDEPFEMGEGPANIYKDKCKIHGETFFIHGYNQGGYDGMAICLKCCAEILQYFQETYLKSERTL